MDRRNTIGWARRSMYSAAALLLVAGTAAAQQGGYGPPGRPVRGGQSGEWSAPPGQLMQQGGQQGGARAMRDQPIYLSSEGGEQDVLVRIFEGRVQAKIDGELVPQEQVQVQGNRVYVMDDFGDTAAVFKVPASVLRAHGIRETGGRGWGQFFDEEPRTARRTPPRTGWQQQPTRPGRDNARFFIPELWAENAWMLEQPKVVLGILMEPVNRQDLRGHEQYTSAVRVERVHEGLAAAKAGLKAGDIVVAIDGKPDVTATEIRRFIREAEPGETVELTVLRNGKEERVTVNLERFEPRELNWDFYTPGPMDDGLNEDWPDQGWQDQDRPDRGAGGQDDGPRLGISIAEAPDDAFEDVEEYSEGVIVQSVQDDLPAAKAGLREGDVIVAFDGKEVGTPEELQDLVNRSRAGQRVEVTVIRDGRTRTLNVTMGR